MNKKQKGLLELAVIVALQEGVNGQFGVTGHVLLYRFHVLGGEKTLSHDFVDRPHDLSHVEVLLMLGTGVDVGHGIDAEQIDFLTS